jgi:hypothetical protein
MPNLDLMEHWVGANPLALDLAPDLDQPHAGLRRTGGGPGLGITIDENIVHRLAGRA